MQGNEVYVLADGDALNSSCDERNDLCPVNHLEFQVIEDENGHKVSTQDEELTSLSWLQNTNLLQSMFSCIFSFYIEHLLQCTEFIQALT